MFGPRKRRSGIRWADVMLGFLAGPALAWVSRITLVLILAMLVPSAFDIWGNSPSGGGMESALLFPTVILVSAIYWAAKKRRKGLAVGMALYGAVAALILGWLALRNGLAW